MKRSEDSKFANVNYEKEIFSEENHYKLNITLTPFMYIIDTYDMVVSGDLVVLHKSLAYKYIHGYSLRMSKLSFGDGKICWYVTFFFFELSPSLRS